MSGDRTMGEARGAERRLTCVLCPAGCDLLVSGAAPSATEVTGGRCPKGRDYALKELTAPTRTLTTTVRVQGAKPDRLPVRTLGEIPKEAVRRAVRALDVVAVTAPVRLGQVIVDDLLGFGVAVVATRGLPAMGEGHDGETTNR
ncbi:MAG: DUF1667 domain-containing protein [Bacillota bacterium]